MKACALGPGVWAVGLSGGGDGECCGSWVEVADGIFAIGDI